METIINVINPFFATKHWQIYKEKENTFCYRQRADEFIVTLLPQTAEIEITVPLNEVRYKNRFNKVNTEAAIDYIKMHLNYYHNKSVL